MILKAGTYRFNDVINGGVINITNEAEFEQYMQNPAVLFNEIPFESASNIYIAIGSGCINGTFTLGGSNITYNNVISITYGGEDTPTDVYISGDMYSGDTLVSSESGWKDVSYQTHTITEDTEVNDTFGTWYIANTNYNEVNAKPLAEITYNGQTYPLDAGDKATIPCKDFKMRTDVVVKVNKIEEPKDDSIVGTWVFNDVLSNYPTVDDENLATIILDFYCKTTVNGINGFIWVPVNRFCIRNSTEENGELFTQNQAMFSWFENDDTGFYNEVYDQGWYDDYNKYVYFSKDVNDQTFKTWLKATATKQ